LVDEATVFKGWNLLTGNPAREEAFTPLVLASTVFSFVKISEAVIKAPLAPVGPVAPVAPVLPLGP